MISAFRLPAQEEGMYGAAIVLGRRLRYQNFTLLPVYSSTTFYKFVLYFSLTFHFALKRQGVKKNVLKGAEGETTTETAHKRFLYQ